MPSPSWIYIGNSSTQTNPDWSTGATAADRATTLQEAQALVGSTYRAVDMQVVVANTTTTQGSPTMMRGIDPLSYTIMENGAPRVVTNTVYTSHVVVNVSINVVREFPEGSGVLEESTVMLRAVRIQTLAGDTFIRPYFEDLAAWGTTLNSWSFRSITIDSIATGLSPATSNTDRYTNGMDASAGYNPSFFNPDTFVCYVSGTLIDTPSGPRRIEDLQAGDLVETLDDGPQKLVWIGRRKLSKIDLAERPQLIPVRIPAGALGWGLPSQDLIVSPQHRVLIAAEVAAPETEAALTLVAAKDLLAIPSLGVTIEPVAEVEYVHILLERHQIIRANGAWSESLLQGPQAMVLMGAEARAELLAIFPELGTSLPAPARPILNGRAWKTEVAARMQNQVPGERAALAPQR